MRIDPSERLSLFRLVVFSSPMLIMQVIEVSWRTYLPSIFATKLGVSLGAVGAMLMAIRLFDAVVEPMVAWTSDHFPTRWGRRRPWMAAGAPLIMLGATGVFFGWPGVGFPGLVVACLVLHLGYVMLVTPHGGWELELARDACERLRITGGKIWVVAASTIAVLLLTSMLERGFGAGLTGQVAALGVALLVLCPMVVCLVLGFIAEPDLGRTGPAQLVNPLRLFAGLLSAPDLRPVLILYAIVGFAQAAGGVLFLFFVDGALGLRGWGSALLLMQMVALLVTTPVWSKLGARLDRRSLLALNFGWQLITAPLVFLLPTGALAPAVGFLLLRGVVGGVDFLALRAMVADIARDSAVRELRQGASYHSVCNTIMRLAMGAGAWFGLSLLAATGNNGVGTSQSSADVAWLMRAVFVLPAMLAGGLGFAVLATESPLKDRWWRRSASREPRLTAPGCSAAAGDGA